MGDLDELVGYERVRKIGDIFRTLANGVFWFALSYFVIQLARFVSAVNGASVVVL